MDLTAKDLRNLHRLCRHEWAQETQRTRLSFSEFEYLQAVQDQEERQHIEGQHGQHLQDVVNALTVTKASASAMISKLEQCGFVERFPCKLDARAHHIILTAEGRARLATGSAVYERAALKATEILRSRPDPQG